MTEFNLTFFEVCEKLNRSKKSITRYIRRGRLHPQKVKSQQGTLEYRFSLADLEAFKAQETAAGSLDTPPATGTPGETGQTRQDRPDGTEGTEETGQRGQGRQDTPQPPLSTNEGNRPGGTEGTRPDRPEGHQGSPGLPAPALESPCEELKLNCTCAKIGLARR